MSFFLAKQGLAFRGHNENSESKNQGTFIEFKAKDLPSFQKFIDDSSFSYLSHEIQNELMNI